MAKALQSNPECAETALGWLLPEASKLIGDWKENAVGKAGEVAQHIECELDIRPYAQGSFDWLGEENRHLKPKTLLQGFDDLVRKATSYAGMGAIVDFIADTPLEKKDLDDIVDAIVKAKYAHSSEENLHEKAAAKADLTARIDLYLGVLAENRSMVSAARKGHWLIPNWFAERITERDDANRNFIADDLAAFLDSPYFAGHPMPPGFASSLKKLGKKDPDMASSFLRTHYSLLNTETKTHPQGKATQEESLALRKMAKKLAQWAAKNPSLGDLYTSLKSATKADQMAATCYLRQQGLSADNVKKLKDATEKSGRTEFETALYDLLYRHKWQDERMQQIIAPPVNGSGTVSNLAAESEPVLALEPVLAG